MSTFGAPGSATSGLQGYDLEGADKKISKTEAAYVGPRADRPEGKQCSGCSMFKPPNACTLVRGEISPEGYCKHYEAKVGKAAPRTLYVKRLLRNASELHDWAKGQGFGTALDPETMHVTLAYSKVPVDWETMPRDDRPLLRVEGGERFLDRLGPNKEAVVLRFESEEAARRHRQLKEAGAHWKWPGYKPHISISYKADDLDLGAITPWEGVLEFGPEVWAEVNPDWESTVVEKDGVGDLAMENLALFVPLLKVDAKQRMVYGQAVAEVRDRVDEVFDYATSKPHFERWSADVHKASDGKSYGNVRSMHGKIAAGKLTDIGFNDTSKAIDVAAKIVDDGEWKKVEEGVYTGFSIGGKYDKRWQDGELKRYTAIPSEISLVDLPCVPTATFTMIKMDGSEELRTFKSIEETAGPEIITNDLIAKRAVAIATKVGDERDWGSYVIEARKQLETELAARQASGVKKSLAFDVEDDIRKEIEKKKTTDTPRAAADGEWEQVWRSPRLPGQFFNKKAELQQALLELDAQEALAKDASGILDALKAESDTDLGNLVDKVWGSNADLPKSVQGLPDQAKSVFREAANGALKSGKSESSAMAIGWTAVKNGWSKEADGTWTRKASKKFADDDLGKRTYSTEQREKYAKEGVAMKDGSFPIPDKEALHDAIQAYGRAGNKAAAKRHIIRRAKALGASDMLPEKWGAGKTKKLVYDAMQKLTGDDLKKAASLHFVADLLHCLACVECLEEQCECDAEMHYMAGVNVPKTLTDQFGKLLVDFGDLISEILDVVLAELREEEATEAMGRAQPIMDLLKIGARHSQSTRAVIQTVHDAMVKLDETVCKVPSPKQTTNTSKPGHSQDGDKEVTVRPGSRAGSEHPGSVNTSGVGDIGPYKDMSAEDLIKAAADQAETIARLEAEKAATATATKRVLDEIAAGVAELKAKNASMEKDLTAIKNTPMPSPAGSFRLVSKAEDVRHAAQVSDVSDDILRRKAMEIQQSRLFGPREAD
jgi:cation transport regulator ChaB